MTFLHSAHASTTQKMPLTRFSSLSQELCDKIKPMLKQDCFSKGEEVIRENEVFKYAYFIDSGFVKIFTRNQQMEDVFLAVQGANETLGEFAVFNENRYPISAKALTALKVWKISAVDFYTLRNTSPEFASLAADYLFLRTQRLKNRLAQMATETIEERLKLFFLMLLKEYKTSTPDGLTFLPFYLTRKELAQAIFSTQETATRIMNKWQKTSKVISTPEGFVFYPNFFSDEIYSKSVSKINQLWDRTSNLQAF